MPSPRKRKSLCIFGDSQIGCIKLALTQKQYSTRRLIDFEFWGADGPRFRGLNLKDGKLVPRPEDLKTVQMVNGNGKDVLDPADFDVILFMGVRIRAINFFKPHLHRMQQADGYLSSAAFAQCCKDWLPRQRFYRAAKALAAVGKARILLAPATFPTEGLAGELSRLYPDAVNADATQRSRIWRLFEQIAQNDRISLVRQPEETVTAGCMTLKSFSRTKVDDGLDSLHRNPEYGALLLEHVVERFM